MRLMHLTPAEHLTSIMRKGLLPQIPKLTHHRRANKAEGLPSKVLYCWEMGGSEVKRIKDTAYCHVWIWRGNAILDAGERDGKWGKIEQDSRAFHKLRPPVVGGCFVALALKSDAVFAGRFAHAQTAEAMEYPCWASLDHRYSHRQHPMVLVTERVPPEDISPWALVWTQTHREGKGLKGHWVVDVHLRKLK